MRILIEKDPLNKVAREVADMDEAIGFAAQGFHVVQLHEDGSTTPLQAEQAAEESAAAPAAKKAPAKKKA